MLFLMLFLLMLFCREKEHLDVLFDVVFPGVLFDVVFIKKQHPGVVFSRCALQSVPRPGALPKG